MRVLPLRGCAGSDSSASNDGLGRRSGFLSFRVVRLFFVRGGAESVESLWTILCCAVFGFRALGMDCPHSSHPSACRRCFCELALWVRRGAESMESGGQSSFALFSGFGFGAWIDHASHTLRCRRLVPVRRSSCRNNPAGLLINDSFRDWAVDMWTILICAAFGFRARGLDCPHSHSPIRPRPGLAKASLNRHREAIFASPCAAPSSAFVEVGDGTAISWLRCSSFRRFGGEPAQSSIRVSFLGRPRFFGAGGGVMSVFARTCSGMRSACFLSR